LSIIYDALKKIEKSVNKSPNVEKESPAEEVKIKRNYRPALIYILLILIGLFCIGGVLYLLTRPKIKPPSSPTPALTVQTVGAPTSDTALDTIPEEKPAFIPDPTLILNGVYFQGNEGYALINNRILKIEDMIQGATLKEISLEKVTLEFEGRVITLVNSAR